ncbi:MAG TPA: sigma-54 dependent transcriptional regulator [Thermoanaerobaculia bacterium]|jgi:DNA-binding NtrC family response regulator|nr:sigma-54 dependent transcriptional regulator [Thermoanaerobaculia bacterium]
MTRVLLVEDDEKIRASLLALLRAEGFAAEACASAEEAEARLLPSGAIDLLLLDVRLPGESGVAFARRLAEAGRLPPTIVLSGEASIGETVEALRLGVHDFLEKPVRRERLLRSIENALSHAALAARVAVLESRIDGAPEILGASPAIERLRTAIRKVAATDARVLIRGESGAGKELVAAAIHAASARRGRPLVKVNCAAFPAHLIEDELFGHARGAFTDAKASRAGLFEEAHGGTLFLDEIGDLDLALQGRLLRVLEDGRVRRLGEARDRAFDVRVIAATHRPLEQEVEAGRFRQDLFFRLAHLPLEVPALRDRTEDVPLLFDHFVARFAERHRLRRREIDPEIYPPLCAYPWPGNVRELSNLAERLVVLGSDPLGPDQLPAVLLAGSASGTAAPTGLLRPQDVWPPLPWREWKAATEREYLETVLRRAEWSFTAAAKLLDLQRTYLHEKAASLGLERPKRDRGER